MTTLADLRTLAANLQRQAEELQSAKDNAEATVKRLRAPYEARVSAVWEESNRDGALRAAGAASEAAQKAVWASVPKGTVPEGLSSRDLTFSSAAEVVRHEVERLEAEAKVPTNAEEYQAYLKAGAGPFHVRHSWRLDTNDQDLGKGLVLLSGREEYGDRYYLGVEVRARKPARIVGYLHVEPSEHRGDSTRADGQIEGKPFLTVTDVEWTGTKRKEVVKVVESASSDCYSTYNKLRKPLAQFKAALRGESAKVLAIAKGEDGVEA